MKWSKAIQRKVRQAGWDAFHAGVKWDGFPGGGERKRAAWEIGWRAAKEGQPKPYTVNSDYDVDVLLAVCSGLHNRPHDEHNCP